MVMLWIRKACCQQHEPVSFTQLWAVVGLAAGFALLLALALLCQQLSISNLRSTRRDLLQQVGALCDGQRDLLDKQLQLQAALRAERALVEQLKRKTQLIEAAMQEEPLCAGSNAEQLGMDLACPLDTPNARPNRHGALVWLPAGMTREQRQSCLQRCRVCSRIGHYLAVLHSFGAGPSGAGAQYAQHSK